ncbi:MRPS35 [Cordylochernes scorpioides]|uniref:MRPS35 n=1 Tax=Cordylochernes scorpioides TaxID=51811 RepID=A0ABY6L9R4_9ARAC|nr:MRPS35 [Cordylochernes scorpioides]
MIIMVGRGRRLLLLTRGTGHDNHEFTPLQLRKKEMARQEAPKTYKKAEVGEPREKSMSTEQDWPTVWPTARSFHPASVPLPLYMGYVKKDAPPYKYANAELMKIPNFLHLTPQAVERHCEALRKFTPLQLRKKEMARQEAPKTYKKAEDSIHTGPTTSPLAVGFHPHWSYHQPSSCRIPSTLVHQGLRICHSVGEPREKSMSTEQDWPTVWPTARSFHPASVPLPLYMGYVKKDAPPYKYANAELMKIPNFLHLTPQAVERHCEALRSKFTTFLGLEKLSDSRMNTWAVATEFCTPWPDGLETEEKCQKHFPVEVTTTDYCHASTTIRDQRARNVTVEFPISSLPLDYHANQKMIRLAGEDRYNPNTNTIKIVGDR